MNTPLAKIIVYGVAGRMGMKCELLYSEDNLLCFRFISEDFKGIGMFNRFKVINNAMEKHCLRVVEKFTLVYEAFTPNELLSMSSTIR